MASPICADGKCLAIVFNERKVMHVVLFSPVLAEFINNPTGIIFIAVLSVAALLRGKI